MSTGGQSQPCREALREIKDSASGRDIVVAGLVEGIEVGWARGTACRPRSRRPRELAPLVRNAGRVWEPAGGFAFLWDQPAFSRLNSRARSGR